MQQLLSLRLPLLLPLLPALLLQGARAAPPSPAFSWDRVATFQHLAFVNATLATEFAGWGDRLPWLAKFPVVFIEHAHGQPYCYAPPGGVPGKTYGPDAYDPSTLSPPGAFFEEHSRAAAAQIKALNPSAVVIYYQQASAAIPFYRAAAGFTAHPEWRASCAGSAQPLRGGVIGVGAEGPAAGAEAAPPPPPPRPLGDVIPNIAGYLVNHTAPGVQAWFVESSLNATRGSQLDGTFFDTGGCFGLPEQEAATVAMVRALQAADTSLIAGLHSGSESGYTDIGLLYTYTLAKPAKVKAAAPGIPGKDTSGRAAFDWMQTNTKAGVLSMCHMGDVAFSASVNYSLAVFLAGATPLTYFGFSSDTKGTNDAPWVACSAGGSDAWPVFPTWCSGMGYTREYDLALGAPDGPAVPSRGKKTVDEVTRTFGGKAVTVVVDLQGDTCLISWADGSTTECGGGKAAD